LPASAGFIKIWNERAIMSEQESIPNTDDRRSGERRPPDKYYSVQFSVKNLAYIYQFKIWNVSSTGLCILVNEDSDVLNYLQVGDIIDMKYYLSEKPGITEDFKTEVQHITKHAEGRFKGHCSVGLLILGKKS
jgi:hypothetical protein